MNQRKNLRLSLAALWRSRARTTLCAAGMAVGITAMVVLLGAAGGAEQAFREALLEMGENLLVVGAGVSESNALRGVGRPFETLTWADGRAVDEQILGVRRTAPMVIGDLRVAREGRSMTVTVIGTTPEMRWTNNQRLVAGRFLDDDDLAGRERVAVVGAHVVRELFRGEQPLGERLSVAGIPFIIIGALREKGLDPTGADEDNRILIPLPTAQRRLMDLDYVHRIFVQAESESAMATVETEIRALLRARHRLVDPDSPDDFTVRSQASVLRALDETDRSMTRWLSGLTAVILGLAAMGLSAVSLLSVRGRHGEIGLRLAVGALPRQIWLQFLVETVLISLAGAVVGLLVGGVIIILGGRLFDRPLTLTAEAVIYPFVVSLAISLVFGVYPALRAARLDPIVALRSR